MGVKNIFYKVCLWISLCNKSPTFNEWGSTPAYYTQGPQSDKLGFYLDTPSLNVTSLAGNIFNYKIENIKNNTLFEVQRNITEWLNLTSCYTISQQVFNVSIIFPIDSLSFCLANCHSDSVLLHQGACLCPQDNNVHGNSECMAAPCKQNPTTICGKESDAQEEKCVCEYKKWTDNLSTLVSWEQNCLLKSNSDKLIPTPCKRIVKNDSGNEYNWFNAMLEVINNKTKLFTGSNGTWTSVFRQPFFGFQNYFATTNVSIECEKNNVTEVFSVKLMQRSESIEYNISVFKCVMDEIVSTPIYHDITNISQTEQSYHDVTIFNITSVHFYDMDNDNGTKFGKEIKTNILKKSANSYKIIIGSALAGGIVFIIVSTLFVIWIKHKKYKENCKTMKNISVASAVENKEYHTHQNETYDHLGEDGGNQEMEAMYDCFSAKESTAYHTFESPGKSLEVDNDIIPDTTYDRTMARKSDSIYNELSQNIYDISVTENNYS